jgi:hypothetical protein
MVTNFCQRPATSRRFGAGRRAKPSRRRPPPICSASHATRLKLNDMLMGGGVAPAISNAMAQLTGVRLRHTPFTPERVEEALG